MGESGKKFVRLLIILLYCVFVILGIAFLCICFNLKPEFYNDQKKFNSIMQMNKEDLLDINNYEKKNLILKQWNTFLLFLLNLQDILMIKLNIILLKDF